MDELFAHFRSYWPRDGSSSSSLGAAGPAAPAAPAEGDGSDEEEEDQESESLDEQDPVPAVESDGYDVELAAALGVPKVVVENLSPKKPSPEKSEKQDPPVATLTESEQRKRRIQELQPSGKKCYVGFNITQLSLF